MPKQRLDLSFEQAESVRDALHKALAVSLAARGLKTIDGLSIDEAYDAIHELAWDIGETLRALLHAYEPEAYAAPATAAA